MTKPLLFTPIAIREVTLKNRVVIAPMATYAAVEGVAQDFHFAHWGRLVLGGAGLVFVEATAVTDQGRITNGDVGIWSAAHVPPLARIAAFMASWIFLKSACLLLRSATTSLLALSAASRMASPNGFSWVPAVTRRTMAGFCSMS